MMANATKKRSIRLYGKLNRKTHKKSDRTVSRETVACLLSVQSSKLDSSRQAMPEIGGENHMNAIEKQKIQEWVKELVSISFQLSTLIENITRDQETTPRT